MNTDKATPRLNWIVARSLIHLDLHEGPENAPTVTTLGSVTKDKLEAIRTLGRAVNAHDALVWAVERLLLGSRNLSLADYENIETALKLAKGE